MGFVFMVIIVSHSAHRTNTTVLEWKRLGANFDDEVCLFLVFYSFCDNVISSLWEMKNI